MLATLTFVGSVMLATILGSSPASADCIQNGTTVTCAPPGTGGFTAGVDGLTLNVQSGASVSVGNNATAISVNDNNTATNNGTITTGANGFGIKANNNNTIVNNGTISAGSAGTGVQITGDGNILNNFGLIKSVGDGFSVETCFCTTNNSITNSGILDGRLDILGIGNTIDNRGLITITDTSTGTPIGVGFTHTIQNTTGGGAGNTFSQSSTGTLALRMDSAGAIDNLLADAITPGGTLRITIQSGLYPSQRVTTSAVGLTGFVPGGTIGAPFGSYVSSSPFFSVTPIYSGGASTSTNYTDLSIQLDRIPFNAVGGLTPNQRAIGDVLEARYSNTLTGNAATFYGNLLAATSTNALDSLAGDGTAVAQRAAFSSGNQFQSALLGQIQLWLSNPSSSSASAAPLTYAFVPQRGHEAFALIKPARTIPEQQPWSVWASGFGGTQKIDADAAAGTAQASQRGTGGAMGVNYSANSDQLFGVSVGGSLSSFSVPDRSTSGDLTGFHLGAFSAQTWHASYVTAALNYSRFGNKTERTISGIGPTETAKGNFSSDLLTARIETGWRHIAGPLVITPFTAVQAAQLWQRGYTETSTVAGGGDGVLGLSYAAVSATSLLISLGAQADSKIELRNGRALLPFARAAWVHEFKPARDIKASFVSIPSASFTAEGPRAAKNSAQIGAGAKLVLNRSTMLFANIDGKFSGRGHAYSGSGGVSMTW